MTDDARPKVAFREFDELSIAARVLVGIVGIVLVTGPVLLVIWFR